eukprot:gene11552-biopygen8375
MTFRGGRSTWASAQVLLRRIKRRRRSCVWKTVLFFALVLAFLSLFYYRYFYVPHYPLYDLCRAHLAQQDAFQDTLKRQELQRTFERFRAVKDHREGDTFPHTAEVRFVTAAHSLNYSVLLPFAISSSWPAGP